MQNTALLIFLFVIHSCAVASSEEFVVWNVGQGLWTTLRSQGHCLHGDMGGEHAPWRLINESCEGRMNAVLFSHWDLDHIGFAARAARLLKPLCLQTPPAGIGNLRKQALLARLKFCEKPSAFSVQEIERELKGSPGSSNDISHVFLAGHDGAPVVLMPGDSTVRAEKNWAPHLAGTATWLLVLGHHGSRTSTSAGLLERLPFVRMAIASSRKAKYGHPHHEVTARLRDAGIALLTTEDWGSLRFEIPARTPPPRPVERATDPRFRITADRVCTRDSNCARPAHRPRVHRRR